MRNGLVLGMCWLLAGAPGAELRGWDVYGTRKVAPEEFAAQIQEIWKTWPDRQSQQALFRLTADLKERHGLYGARFSGVTYYGPQGGDYLTLDVVETAEQEPELLPEPQSWFFVADDPGGLLRLWQDYDEKGTELLRSGVVLSHRHTAGCPSHCLYGFEHPDLQSYRIPLAEGAQRYRAELARIFRSDRDGYRRGLAAFVLANSHEPARVVELLAPRLLDKNFVVRNNVARVLGSVAERFPAVEIPLEPVLKLLACPVTTDRNKAAWILAGLVEQPGGVERYGPEICRRGGAILIDMLRLRQPNNHDWAYRILKKLAGRDLGERDYRAWEDWLSSQTG